MCFLDPAISLLNAKWVGDTCGGPKRSSDKKAIDSQAWWHMPVVAATQKAGAGRLHVQSQPGLDSENLFQNKIFKKNQGYSLVVEGLLSMCDT